MHRIKNHKKKIEEISMNNNIEKKYIMFISLIFITVRNVKYSRTSYYTYNTRYTLGTLIQNKKVYQQMMIIRVKKKKKKYVVITQHRRSLNIKSIYKSTVNTYNKQKRKSNTLDNSFLFSFRFSISLIYQAILVNHCSFFTHSENVYAYCFPNDILQYVCIDNSWVTALIFVIDDIFAIDNSVLKAPTAFFRVFP